MRLRRNTDSPARGRTVEAVTHLSAAAAQKLRDNASKARREVLILTPLVIAVVAAYRYREEIFGADEPVRVVCAIALGVARLVGRPRHRPRGQPRALQAARPAHRRHGQLPDPPLPARPGAASGAQVRRPRPARTRGRWRVHRGRARPRRPEHARQRARRPAAPQRAAVPGRRPRALPGGRAGRSGRGRGDAASGSCTSRSRRARTQS